MPRNTTEYKLVLKNPAQAAFYFCFTLALSMQLLIKNSPVFAFMDV